VEARDEKELIGQGTHERVIVELARFEEKLRSKSAASDRSDS
jgi:predicted thioesterase